MHGVKIQGLLDRVNGAHAVIANDVAHRRFVGVSDGLGAFLLVEIDRVTRLELERGTLDASTAMRERCAGKVALLPTASCKFAEPRSRLDARIGRPTSRIAAPQPAPEALTGAATKVAFETLATKCAEPGDE
jgi:hypothetical protein